MNNNKIQVEIDITDILGLNEPKKNTLEYDLNYVMENGVDKYVNELNKHEEEKRWFLSLFRECYDELCLFMEKDPKRRVPISCFTCIKGMDLSKQYGKPKK